MVRMVRVAACGCHRVTVAVFILFITRVCHTTIRVTHVFITRVIPRVTLRVIVAACLKNYAHMWNERVKLEQHTKSTCDFNVIFS